MITFIQRYKIQLAAAALILAGLGIMIPKGLGLLDAYREAQYAITNNFRAGNLAPDLMRPWMTMRYVATAYAVPQEYLFQQLGIQPRKETSMLSLSRLNQTLQLGGVKGQPEIMEKLRVIITRYRAAPVATGLLERHVEDWMNIQYIANSLGVPADTIFQELNIAADGHAYLPLGPLADEVKYPGGPGALVQALQKIVDAHPGPTPAAPPPGGKP